MGKTLSRYQVADYPSKWLFYWFYQSETVSELRSMMHMGGVS